MKILSTAVLVLVVAVAIGHGAQLHQPRADIFPASTDTPVECTKEVAEAMKAYAVYRNGIRVCSEYKKCEKVPPIFELGLGCKCFSFLDPFCSNCYKFVEHECPTDADGNLMVYSNCANTENREHPCVEDQSSDVPECTKDDCPAPGVSP